jgi:peptide deformylase|tara:strand:- start:968 stop:1489 length:522 start_codon:yes stop_codon:yes gene_type:complete
MSILKISRLGHPILLQKTEPVVNFKTKEIENIIHNMTETMLDAKGIGLAAPQVYINKQIIIFRVPEEEDGDNIKITALINPKITNISEETNNQWEGCLSIPGMLGLVKRFSKIKYEGYDMYGNLISREVEELHARVVQHEYDHLMGILYINRLADKNAYGFVEEIEDFWKNKT